MKKLLKLWIELKITYYNWAMDSINKAMVVAYNEYNDSIGKVKQRVKEDLIELADDRVEVKAKIRKLENKLAGIK